MTNKKAKLLEDALQEIVDTEHNRQLNEIQLIASENYTSKKVRDLLGSCLTNKYAEGYPGKRYYHGCFNVDSVEEMAIEQACSLFNCGYANVQPHSGSQANAAAYAAILDPGDTLLSLRLDHGGHLTHGCKVSHTSRFYNTVHYTTLEDGSINFIEVEEMLQKHKPKLLVAGYSAHTKELDLGSFRSLAKKYECYFMVDMAHFAGFVAAGLMENPCDYADIVTSTTHKTLRGPRGGLILSNNEYIAKRINREVFPGMQGGPLMNVIAAKAQSFIEAATHDFKAYMLQVRANAFAMYTTFERSSAVMPGGPTDNHMILINTLETYNLTGAESADILAEYDITVNKNSMPNDTKGPNTTSGIRIGTPAFTTLGATERSCTYLAMAIDAALFHKEEKTRDQKVKLYLAEARKHLSKFKIF